MYLEVRYIYVMYLDGRLTVYFLFQVRAKFTVDDYSHYFFTPCILTQWVLGLFRYDLEGGKFCCHDFKLLLFGMPQCICAYVRVF